MLKEPIFNISPENFGGIAGLKLGNNQAGKTLKPARTLHTARNV